MRVPFWQIEIESKVDNKLENKDEIKKLVREFSFTNFLQAVQFVNLITPLCEGQNHHPDILLHRYRKLKISLYTHTVNQITEKDYRLAKEINRVWELLDKI